MKKDGLFDVTMEAYDGAEGYELAGIFVLDKIREKYDNSSVGLYSDNVLSVFKNEIGTQLEKIERTYRKHSRTLV